MTTGQLVAGMSAGLAVGLMAGFALRSRWAMLLGRHRAIRRTRVRVHRQIQAPGKRLYTFPNAGHSVAFDQYQALNRVMSTVLTDRHRSTRR